MLLHLSHSLRLVGSLGSAIRATFILHLPGAGESAAEGEGRERATAGPA